MNDPLALLTPTERRRYRFGDAVAKHLPALSIAWNRLFMVNVVRVTVGRRLCVRGLEHLAAYGPDARVILVANHRSFFDFFAIGAVLYTRTRLPKRVLFPVRATFFYDHALGSLVNGVMAGFTMFPPIVREAERHAFNRFALERCAEELAAPGRMIGVHPEGRRSLDDDPYSLLPAQPGVGKIAVASPGVVVIPIWVQGLTSSVATEVRRNYFAPKDYPIDIAFGAPVAIDDLRGENVAVAITERCMDAIASLAAETKELRAPLWRSPIPRARTTTTRQF